MFARENAHSRNIFIIALVSIAILVLLWRPMSTPPKLISTWQPKPIITQPDQPQHIENVPTPAPITGAAVPAVGFNLKVDDGLYADQRDALAQELQDALNYVVQRFGTAPSSPFDASLVWEQGCGLHGIAYTDIRQVQTFTCNDIERSRAVAIMAHEFVHQLEQDRYGPVHLSSDLILSEGTATWGAGKYWLSGQPDFRTFVRNQRASGAYFPLATHYSGLGIAAMNTLYYEWASFVDFLIGTYGRDKFDQLYASGGGGAPGSANYAGVYGKGLDALQDEWLAWLDK